MTSLYEENVKKMDKTNKCEITYVCFIRHNMKNNKIYDNLPRPRI